MIKMYGLKICDTCRNAKTWLKDQALEYEFADVRQDGIEREQLEKWIGAVGWETLLNRRGTTWRTLDEADKEELTASKAAELMAAYPALIKRPVFEIGDRIVVGFKEEQKAALTA